jgi:hypothetical protein
MVYFSIEKKNSTFFAVISLLSNGNSGKKEIPLFKLAAGSPFMGDQGHFIPALSVIVLNRKNGKRGLLKKNKPNKYAYRLNSSKMEFTLFISSPLPAIFTAFP